MRRTVVLALWAIAIVVYVSAGWVVGLALGVAALVANVLLLVRTARELAPSLLCPRGHRVPTYGRVACSQCGFVSEGSVWWCPECGARYGHTPCPTCGLSVRNPAVRRPS